MKQIMLDFSSAGFMTGLVHFVKGIVLYAAVGAVGYVTARLSGWHPGTMPEIGLTILAGEGLQAVSKWLTTAKDAVDAQDIVPDPATLA